MPTIQRPRPGHDREETTASLNAALAAVEPASRESLDALTGLLERMTRAYGMRRVAEQTGLGRESLYKSMKAGATPEIGTVLRVLLAMGFRLQAVPIDDYTSDE